MMKCGTFPNRSFRSAKRQEGVALITVLIITTLIIITVASSQRNTNIELKITNSGKQTIQTFYQTEMVLREGEIDVREMDYASTLNVVIDTDVETAPGSPDFSDPETGSVSNGVTDGRKVEQYLGTRTMLNESLNEISSQDDVSNRALYYKVTSQYQTPNQQAARVIQSIFSVDANGENISG